MPKLSLLEKYKEYGVIFIRLIVGFHLIYGTQDNILSYARMAEFAGFLSVRGVPFPLFSAFLSISGVKVIVEGESGQRFEVISNNEGFYKMVDLPSGRYKVRAEIPPYLSLARDNQNIVEVPSKGCATADFLTRADGRISGVLLDAQGRVVPESDVELIPFELADKVGDRRIGRYKKTDEAGRFEFTELKPGRYLLGVNMRSQPDGDNPFRRTYFPGVSNVAESKVVVLGKGEKVKGYDLRLPPRLR